MRYTHRRLHYATLRHIRKDQDRQTSGTKWQTDGLAVFKLGASVATRCHVDLPTRTLLTYQCRITLEPLKGQGRVLVCDRGL